MTVVFIGLQSFSISMEKDSSSLGQQGIAEADAAYANKYYTGGDTLHFSGYRWTTKESNDRHTGPGRNFFAGGRENIWVDDKGKMHIRTTHNNGRWYCAEARLVESL